MIFALNVKVLLNTTTYTRPFFAGFDNNNINLKMKKMKKIILLLILPLISYSQDLNSALNLHNTLRGYYDLKPLAINEELNIIAEERAELIAEQDKIIHSENDYGENIFYTTEIKLSRDYFLEASITWIVEVDNKLSMRQMLCSECKEIGFGVSMSNDKVFVVALYDEMYDENIIRSGTENNNK